MRKSIKCLVSILSILIFGIEFAQAADATVKIEDIVNIIKIQESMIKSLQVNFKVKSYFADEPQNVLSIEEGVWAIQGEKEYIKWTDIILDKDRQISTEAGWNGEVQKIIYTGERNIQGIIKESKGPEYVFPGFPRRLLMHAGFQSVATYLSNGTTEIEGVERVDDKEYYVVTVNIFPEISRDKSLVCKLWLDKTKDFLPVKQETYNRGKPWGYMEAELKKMESGIIIPVRGKGWNFPFRIEEENRTARSVVTEIEIDEGSIRLNRDIDPKLFDLCFEKGTRVFDELLQVDYEVPK